MELFRGGQKGQDKIRFERYLPFLKRKNGLAVILVHEFRTFSSLNKSKRLIFSGMTYRDKPYWGGLPEHTIPQLQQLFLEGCWWLVFWCLALCPATGMAQSFDIKNYGFEDGLSHRNVFALGQDPNGFMWFATVNGLNRYDGYEFVSFTAESAIRSIPHDYLTDLHFDAAGRPWLSSDNQVFRINDIQAPSNVLRLPTFEKTALTNRLRVDNKFCAGGEKGVWVVTKVENERQVRVQRWSPDKGLEEHGFFRHPMRVELVSAFSGHLFLVDGDQRIMVMDTLGRGYRQHQIKLENQEQIQQMSVGADGGVWLLTNQGQFYHCPTLADTFRQKMFFAPQIRGAYPADFWVSQDQAIWLAYENALFHYDPKTKNWFNLTPQVEQLIQKSCRYRQIFQDALGVVWVATDYGPIKITVNDPLFESYLSEGNENCSNGFCSTRGITEDEKGNIYISYYNSIHVLYALQDKIRPLFRNRNFFNYPFALKYFKGNLYTGNGRRIDLKTFAIDTILHQKSIDKGSVMVDADSIMWFGYLNRLYQYLPEKDSLWEYVDPSGRFDTLQDISYVYQGPTSGIIWVATNTDGLYGFDKKDGCIVHYTADSLASQPISHHRINTVLEDQQGRLWLGTAYGLNRIDRPSGVVTVYLPEQGLSNSFVNGILPEGDSCLWVSTDNGLCRFSIRKEQFVNYFKEDGLSENEFNRISFHKGADGKLYFGGLNGVNSFVPGPRFSQKDQKNGQIHLTAFSFLDGRSDSLITRWMSGEGAGALGLGHRDRFFEFSFVLTDYRNPSENRFQYQLEGFEPEWSEPTSLHQVRYHNIPAGDYVFKVRASGKYGGWTEQPLEIPVRIEEAFYRKWSFRIFAALLILSLLFGVYWFRVYQLQRRERALEEEVRERTMELEIEKQKSEELLLNILPLETAEELKKFGKAKARRYDQVSILFCDFKDFTKVAEQLEPEELVTQIDFHFGAFDRIIGRHGLEKIKTVGDAYICVGGLSDRQVEADQGSAAAEVVEAAMEIQTFLKRERRFREENGLPFFEARIGIHTGSVVAGVVGLKKFAYDIWGDAVNIASRMEGNSQPGKINISEATYQLIADQYHCIYRGKITAKNKGAIDMYFVESPQEAVDPGA